MASKIAIHVFPTRQFSTKTVTEVVDFVAYLLLVKVKSSSNFES